MAMVDDETPDGCEYVGIGCHACGHTQLDMVVTHCCEKCGGHVPAKLYRRALPVTQALSLYVQGPVAKRMRASVLVNGHQFRADQPHVCIRCGLTFVDRCIAPPCSGA